MDNNIWHQPVLKNEVVEYLNCKSGSTYLDVTLGGGGWAEAILKASSPDGRLIGIDRDNDAIEEAARRLEKFKKRCRIFKGNFSNAGLILRKEDLLKLDGIVADLGVSKHQLDLGERGFSFRFDSRLDMRMDKDEKRDAHYLVNKSSIKDLEKWFFEYGEERFSRKIAKAIKDAREKKTINTTGELAAIVKMSVPQNMRHGRIHPATRVFQALRIAVNDELGELKRMIESLTGHLNSNGRFVIVSYHSLEDRIVKREFKRLADGGEYRIITKKPVVPCREEILANRSARSAKLRVLEKI